jgi:hypothetical protein
MHSWPGQKARQWRGDPKKLLIVSFVFLILETMLLAKNSIKSLFLLII